MRKALFVVLAFCVISIGLTWLWTEWLRALYGTLLAFVAPPVYEWIGLGDVPMRPMRLRYINFVPFVSLVLVTPGLTMARRGAGLTLGIFAIFLCHLGVNLTAALAPSAALPVPAALFSDAFPFVIWFLVAYPVVKRTLMGVLEDEKPTDVDL